MIAVARRLSGLTLLMGWLITTPASADPVRITTGSLQFGPDVLGIPVTLSGDNFTFNATTSVTEGIFTPVDQCGVEVCVPGTTVNLRSLWLGLGFHSATVTYNGETFSAVGSLNSDASMLTEWTGGLLIPAGFTGGTLRAPVDLTASFVFHDAAFNRVTVPLFGSGTATLGFVPFSDEFPNAFRVQSLRFDIGDAASPTPEPASMLLLGSGVSALLVRARRRRAH